MEDGESILTEKHAIPLLLFVLNNEGCLMSDLQYSVTKNFDTVRRLCVKMSDAGLMEDRNVRERKLVTRYYLTKKGVTVAMMLKCAIDVCEGRPTDDLKGFLEEHYGPQYEKAMDIPAH